MISSALFQSTLLDWFDQHGRKNLPWQQNKTPYRVWISEIMLQQTQVTTVIPYFERFISRFPDLLSLANANQDEVLHLWAGLGYYSRARNLHSAAKMLISEFQGRFPDTIDALIKLPGIGQSTAGAICAIAFQKKAVILDGNVKRVLTRLFAIKEWPGNKKVSDELWQIAAKLTPDKRVADYTQAIMDLGATLCIRGQPHCSTCPFATKCMAKKQGIQKTIPAAKPQKTLPTRQTGFLIFQHHQKILLQKRSGQGVWCGLWSLPELSGDLSLEEIKLYCRQLLNVKATHIAIDPVFRHTFSHFHLDITPIKIKLHKIPTKIMDSEHQFWYNLQQPQKVGLPAPVQKLLREL